MKRSQLRQLVLEAMKGYTKNPQTGEIETTQGGTTDDFRNILTKIAKGHPEEDKEPIYEGEEGTYLVTYYTEDKYGNDNDWDEEVKATSEEDAIAQVKAKGIRRARAFSAKLLNK